MSLWSFVISFILMNFLGPQTFFPYLSLLVIGPFSDHPMFYNGFLFQGLALPCYLIVYYCPSVFCCDPFYLFFLNLNLSLFRIFLFFWGHSCPFFISPWVTYLLIRPEVGLILGRGDFATTPPPLPVLPLISHPANDKKGGFGGQKIEQFYCAFISLHRSHNPREGLMRPLCKFQS